MKRPCPMRRAFDVGLLLGALFLDGLWEMRPWQRSSRTS